MTVCIIAIFPSRVLANSTVLFSETFDAANALDGWQEVRNKQYVHPAWTCQNQREPATWEIVDGAVEIVIDSEPCTMELVAAATQFDRQQQYQFSIDVTFLESIQMDRNLLFFWIDENNWYDIKVTNNDVRIQKVVNGVVYELPNSIGFFPFQANNTYHVDVAFSPTLIELVVNQAPVLQVVDSDPHPSVDHFFVGLQAGVGALRRSVSRFDNLTVAQIAAGTALAVPQLKQTDPRWAELEYDHATEWSERTGIADWGCALTSLTMIMQYYGLTQLPDGAALTPATLNEWLRNQPDGYIGDGLLNIIAATRLTKQLSTLRGTPALEYNRKLWSSQSSFAYIADEIAALRPVIIQIPGHFLVGSGSTEGNEDVTIIDPAYDYTVLSQHSDSPLSLRTFTPSFTDLSYLLVVPDQNTNVELISPDKNQVVEVLTEQLAAYPRTENNQTNELTTLTVRQPVEGTYQLNITAPGSDTAAVQLFSYDEDGTVQLQKIDSAISPDETLSYAVTYQHGQPTILTPIGSWSTYRYQLEQLFAADEIGPLSWWWLDQFALQAIEAPAENTTYKQLETSLITWYRPSLTDDIADQLLHQISIIPE